MKAIITTPDSGEHLKGSWLGFHCYHFHRKPEMRIIYMFYPCCKSALTENVTEDEMVCRFTDTEDIADCGGFIEFAFVKTREKCNNLYGMKRKYADKFRRE